MEPWMQEMLDEYATDEGMLPPPWIAFLDSHPYSLRWRMGEGEGFMQAWRAWWKAQAFSEEQQLAYFRRYSPPPRWLEWTFNCLWDMPFGSLFDESIDNKPFFQRAESLGFGSFEQFEQDIKDPGWRKNPNA